MLTELQERLADAHALAIAAAVVTRKVADHVADPVLRRELEVMRGEADETRARCLEVERRFGGEVPGELLARVNATKEKASDLAGAWFHAGTGPLTAWTFLAMGEAAEVATWTALRVLAATAGDLLVAELADWALPVQRRHLETALAGASQLAVGTAPKAPRGG